MDEVTRGYRDLICWQKAMDLVPLVYQHMKKLPREELYGLSDQIRRAVISVPANIAEGQGREHTAEFYHHLSIARGSLAELDTLLLLCRKLEYFSAEDVGELELRASEVRRLLQGLMKAIKKK
jgi:four helix bundle protein